MKFIQYYDLISTLTTPDKWPESGHFECCDLGSPNGIPLILINITPERVIQNWTKHTNLVCFWDGDQYLYIPNYMSTKNRQIITYPIYKVQITKEEINLLTSECQKIRELAL